MEPAAVLAVVVKARGITATNAGLKSVQANLVKAEAAGVSFGSGLQKSGAKAAAVGGTMQGAGRRINRSVGLPLAAVSALSAKAAIDFEDSFADIRKTVDATEPQFVKLEGGVRNLAKQIPISVHELNELGGSAGALGIKRKALLPFIKTAAELGTTTDLSSNEASISLARLSNVMGTSEKDFRRLGSTFVDLGNKGASTEQEIANMSLRIAGAGKQVGLSESEVLAFGSALSSVGVRAEAGGSAISKVFSEMALNVANGSKKVQEFGNVAGITGPQFEHLFKADAGEAMIKFIEGLDRIRKSGGNVYGVLEDLELKDIRVRDSLLRAAGAGKLFREQLKVGAVEWKQNNALTQEAAERYGTTASQIEMAKNKIYDFGITLGRNVLPVIAELLGYISDVAGWLNVLPEGTQQNILKFIALTVALGVLLSLLGRLVTAYSYIPKAIGVVVASLGANKVANDTLAVSYGQTALAAEASAAAQIESAAKVAAANKAAASSGQMTMLMPDPPTKGAPGQLSLLGTTPPPPPSPAPAAVAKEATKTSRIWSSSFAMGMARFVPGALALVGLGNILSSVAGGDMEGAAWKSGGAAAGAVAGGIAFGLPGALAGAGIGSIVGGFMGDLFGSNDGISAWQEHIKEATNNVRNNLASQRVSFKLVGTAQDRLSDIGKRQARVSHRVKAAEENLAQARKSGKAGAPAVRKAEEALAHWKGKEIRLTKRQHHWENLLSGARARSKQHSRQLRSFEVEMIRVKQAGVESSRNQVKQAFRTLESHTRNGASLKVLTEDEERLLRKRQKARKAVQAREEWEKRLGATMKEITKRFGPAYADQLRKQIPLWTQTKAQVKASEAAFKRLAPGITPITVKMRQFGERGKDATKDVKKGVVDVREVMGPFQSQSTTQLKKAGDSMIEWRRTSVEGVGTVEAKLGGFAGELGLKNVSFGIKTKKNQAGPKKQTGGMVVPGIGGGDKVPLNALVEPGEVVHVLNTRASKDREKLHHLESLNSSVPRFPHRSKFQAGGTMTGSFNVDGAKPGFVPFMNFLNSLYGPIYVMSGLRPGSITTSGNISNHASGNAVDISTTAGGLNMAVNAATLNATGAAAKRMDALHGYMASNIKLPGDFLWRTDTGGNHWNHIHRGITSAHSGNPALMMAYLSKLPKGGMFGGIPKMDFTGPEGALTETGQAVVDHAVRWANEWMSQQAMSPNFGTGTLMHGHGGGKTVGASTYAPDAYTGTVGAAGKSLIGTMAFAELGMGNNLGGLPFGGKMRISHGNRSVIGEKLDIGAGGGDVQGYRRDIDLWYETAEALGLPGQPHPGWLGLLQVERLAKGGMLGRLQAGGTGKPGQKSKEKQPPISKSIKNVLSGLKEGKHLPKYQAQLKKLRRRIDGLGINKRRLERLGGTTGDIERFAEYASNASAMTLQNEDGTITQGLFRGKAEGSWLNDQLGGLMKLRKELLGVHSVIQEKNLPRVDKLMKEARERLRHIRKVIREAEHKKREFEQKIKDIEKAQNENKQELEKREKELERALDKEQGAEKPNKDKIASIRSELGSVKSGLSDNDKNSGKEIKELREKIKDIEGKNKGRKRVEGALVGTIIPGFEAQHTGLHETMISLFADGGQVGNTSFSGLKTVQGAGGPLDEIPNPPPYGMLGGEIFGVQDRLRTIKEEMDRKPDSTNAGDDSEADTLAKELAEEWKKRYLVSQAQFSVLRDFPSVGATQVPFAGSFASGGVARAKGVVAARVGERGEEIAVMPQGARIIPSQEAQTALAGSGMGDIKFEQVTFIESENRVTGRVNGQNFDLEVKSVNRKQSLKSMSRTPGGQGLRPGK